MKLNGKHILSFGAILILVSSCYNDSKEALYDQASITCDTNNVTYQNTIVPIVSTNCAVSGCHDANTSERGLDLSTYADLSNIAHDGRLLSRIRRMPGAIGLMPKDGPPLPDCNIEQIRIWVEAGALE